MRRGENRDRLDPLRCLKEQGTTRQPRQPRATPQGVAAGALSLTTRRVAAVSRSASRAASGADGARFTSRSPDVLCNSRRVTPIGRRGAGFEAGLQEPMPSTSSCAVGRRSSGRRSRCRRPSHLSSPASRMTARFPRRRRALPHRQARQRAFDHDDGRLGRATPLVLSRTF